MNAGAILSEPLTDPSAPKIEGSVMLALAETREEVVEQLRGDAYFRGGVWDWERVVIYPVSGEWFVWWWGRTGGKGGGRGGRGRGRWGWGMLGWAGLG